MKSNRNIFLTLLAVSIQFSLFAVQLQEGAENSKGTTERAASSSPGFLYVDAGTDIVLGCGGSTGCVTLTADFLQTFETDALLYEVTQIPFDVPFPFSGLANSVNTNIDDAWSSMDVLPFDFCFFGNLEQNFWVGSNGVITFKPPAGTYNAWPFSMDLPNNTEPALAEANIFTPAHDINPAVSGSVNEIAYEVIGTYPNRVLAVSYYQVPLFSCTSLPATHMAVFYEFSNIIDIYIQSKPICPTWNSGNAALGIQNNTGTIAYVPPGRNTSDSPWETYEEAWRFSPIGNPTFDFAWVDSDGNFIDDAYSITVCPEDTTSYTAQVTYTNTCNNDEVILEDEITVRFANEIEMDLGEDIAFCGPIEHILIATPDNINFLGTISYAWYQNGILLPNTGSSYTVTQPGTYTVIVSKVGIDCSTTDTITISTNEFEVSLGNDVDACDITEYILTATISGNVDLDEVSYLWSTGEITPSITVTDTDFYSVEVFYGNCVKEDTVFIALAETPEVSLGDNIQKCPTEAVTITAHITNEIESTLTYSWYFGGGQLPESTPSITVSDNGVYRVEVHNGDCIAEAEVEVMGYTNNLNCVISQGISPNGSPGQNDNLDLEFLASRTGIELLQVFNRHGLVVYEKANYINEWVGQSDKGDDLPSGTYYYMLNLSGDDPVYGTQFNGWVYINRGIN